MITEIWYSVQNCGDGSAYPQFMESKELAEIDQKFVDEGWAEPCIGSISIESDGPVKILSSVETVADCIKDTEENLEWGPDQILQDKLEALKELEKRLKL